MDDIVYRIAQLSDGKIDIGIAFRDELPNDAIFYTDSGECQQKIMVSKHKVFYITLHGTLFSGNDRLSNLTPMQLKLFYKLSKNKLK